VTPEEFVSSFETVAEGPGGIKRLREMVLDLAMSGKLVARQADDESVEALLKRVSATLEHGKSRSKGSDDLSPIGSEIAGLVPKHWQWEKLGKLAEVVGGVAKGRDLHGRQLAAYPYLRVANVQRGALDLSEVKEIEIPPEELPRYKLNRGDVLFTEGGDWDKLGRSAVWEDQVDPCLHQNHVFRARFPVVDLNPRWFSMYANSSHGRRYFEGAAKRTTNLASINMTQLRNCPMPVPPTKEQKRIIAKVDQLMALCDDLEARQAKKRETAVRLNRAALDALTTAEGPEEVAASFRRVAENFEIFADNLESVEHLRRTIISVACRGGLSKDFHKGIGPAICQASRLTPIDNARNLWFDEQKALGAEATRAKKKLQEQDATPPSLALPSSWVWASLLRACWQVVDCHNKTAPYVLTGIPLVRTSDIRNGKVTLQHARRISPETYARWSRRCPPSEGDVLFTREAPMGEAGIVEPGMKLCMGQRVMLLRPFPDSLDSKYLLLTLRDPAFQARMNVAAVGSTVKHLRVGDVESLFIPLPTLEEQKFIVAKVDQLMALCDTLEAALRRAESTAQKLAEAVVAELVA
jgi:type I restriction enzyme S subunit